MEEPTPFQSAIMAASDSDNDLSRDERVNFDASDLDSKHDE